jgi:hypothetical protein
MMHFIAAVVNLDLIEEIMCGTPMTHFGECLFCSSAVIHETDSE